MNKMLIMTGFYVLEDFLSFHALNMACKSAVSLSVTKLFVCVIAEGSKRASEHDKIMSLVILAFSQADSKVIINS